MSGITTSGTHWWLVPALVLAVAACGDEPTGPDAIHLDRVSIFAKPGGKPGGGGKPSPSADIPLKVTFDHRAPGIRADDGGPDGDLAYEDKKDLVSAKIKDIGQFYFQTFDGKRKDDPARWVRVVVDEASVVEHEPDHLAAFKAALVAAGDSWPDFTSDVTIHTRNTDGGMYTMGVGTTLVDGGKIGFNDYGENSWEWRLLFDTRVVIDGVAVADGVGLCVTRDGIDEWTVAAEDGACGGDVDSVTELWRVQGGVFTHVADFNTPMHLTLERKD
ncbi:MAG: hypothetical protein HKO65_09790 [Gemmatimonadetes bacterium]|nr:hypothetical protein [Gemmatimonadota bacterium]